MPCVCPMDPPTIVNTFKYTSQQPMFNVLEPPLHYRSSSPHQTNPTNFQDISFSSYLKSKDPALKPHQNDDTEISIFDAQKYFSENSDVKKQQESMSHANAEGYGRNFRTRSFHSTPTVSSEASWNSQTGLLANPPGSVGVNLRNLSDSKKRNSVARKWIFGRKCCCNGKKSVQVKEAEAVTSDSEHGGPVITAENNNSGKSNYVYAKGESYKAKAPPNMSSIHQHKVVAPSPVHLSQENEFPEAVPPRQQRISASGRTFVDGTGGFSFPILNSSTSTPVTKGLMITKPIISPIEDPPRDSLEVFQPMHEIPSLSRPNLGSGSPIGRVTNTDDDAVSDASSDLFEIESFSTQTTSYPMYRRRDSLDEAPTFNARRFASANGLTLNSSIQYGRKSLDEPPTPSVAATECYAPSEVSIDWSVTTAEGFDRASVSNFSVSASEVGTAAFLRQRLQHQQEELVGGDSGRRKGNGGGMLLMSCRQEKAVSVGPQPVKCVIPVEGPPVFPVHVSGRPPRANKAVALGSDHSARMSLAFAA